MEGCKLTKTSEAEAPERKGNRSINREEPFCVAEGFTSGDANNGDSGDRKSEGCCGSGLNLFSSGAASSVLAATATAGGGEDERGATTPSPPPDADDFLCNLGESPLETVIFGLLCCDNSHEVIEIQKFSESNIMFCKKNHQATISAFCEKMKQ